MNLNELNSGANAPETKPWLTPVVYALEALDIVCDTLEAGTSITTQDMKVNGRITQEGSRTTPFSVWACTTEFKTNATTPAFALGSAVGSPSIPATSLYAGNSYRVKLAGTWSTAAADTATINIANLAGDFVYATTNIYAGGAVTNEQWSAEFDIEIQSIGGAGTGKLASTTITTRCGTGPTATSVIHSTSAVNITTFNSTGGIYLAPYIGVGVGTSTVTRNLGYCVSLY